VLAKNVQHPWAHLGEVNRVNVGASEGLSVETNVNVGGVTRALLSTGTDLVDIGQNGIGPYSAETKNKIGQRSTKVLGESHVGSGVSFGDSSLLAWSWFATRDTAATTWLRPGALTAGT